LGEGSDEVGFWEFHEGGIQQNSDNNITYVGLLGPDICIDVSQCHGGDVYP
jgi:hypothetical protein